MMTAELAIPQVAKQMILGLIYSVAKSQSAR